MSSSGIRRERSTDSRIADSILDEDRIQIESEKIFKETGDASTANSSGIANVTTPGGNFLAKSGDTRDGPMGNQLGIVEIIDDTIDVSLGSQNFFPVIILNGEGGAADALTRIVPGSGVFLNQEIMLQAGSFAITLQEIVAGNILTPGGAAFNLEPGDYAKLIFSVVAGNKWIVVWFSGNVGGGGGGISFPEDFPGLDMGSPTISVDIDYTDADRHFRAIELSDNLIVNLLNVSPSTDGKLGTIYFKQDGIGGHIPVIPLLDNQEELEIIGTNPGETTVFTIQVFNGSILGFTSGKNIFFGSSVSDWANFQAVNNINFATFDGTNIDRLLFNQAVGSSLFGSDTGITSNIAGELLSNVPTGSNHIYTVNNVFPAALVISETTLVTQTLVPAAVDDLGLSIAPWNNVFANNGNFDDVVMNTGSITEVAITQYVDVGSVVRGSISGDATLGLVLSTTSGGKFSIQDVITPIVTFDNTTGLTIEGNHVINMGNNIINTISELQLSNTNSHTPSNELSIAFDIIDDALKYAVALTTDTHRWYANTDLLATISRIGTNQGQLSIEAVVSNILQANEQLFLALFTNTTPSNGDIWRDLTDGEFKFRQNGITEVLGEETPNSISEGDSSITVNDTGVGTIPVVVDGTAVATWDDTTGLTIEGTHVINMSQNIINTIGSLQFDNAVTFTPLAVNTIGFDNATSAMKYNVALTTDIHSFQAGGELLASISRIGSNEGQLSIHAVVANDLLQTNKQIFIADSSTDPILNGTFSRNGDLMLLQTPGFGIRNVTSVAAEQTIFNIVKVDTAPGAGDSVGEIQYQVDDSGVLTTFASIQTFILNANDNAGLQFNVRANNGLIAGMTLQGDDNNQRFELIIGGTTGSRIQPFLGVMGYFVTPQVTDFSINVGTSGSLECPRINDGSPSFTDLNQAGGAFNISLFVHDINDGTLYVKNSNTQWDAYARTGTVT